ncbi:hypothetical protein VPHG_00042 [Vibrio phage 11895-B1]|uniref:hypothetical protein n=1 Tax=Vibrio phage 11895-B1 TaxID=754075 RepID=UPI0002C14FF8|nr:hypothetical protein VPHG_00042 [Vibrio phage 11895-B1]AGH32109.1 hypothetical protein VPHG_00042 [Vibrio phage 11895-B1]
MGLIRDTIMHQSINTTFQAIKKHNFKSESMDQWEEKEARQRKQGKRNRDKLRQLKREQLEMN